MDRSRMEEWIKRATEIRKEKERKDFEKILEEFTERARSIKAERERYDHRIAENVKARWNEQIAEFYESYLQVKREEENVYECTSNSTAKDTGDVKW